MVWAAGVAIAIKSRRPDIKIIGVESKAFPAMKQSLTKGSLQKIEAGVHYCRWYLREMSWRAYI